MSTSLMSGTYSSPFDIPSLQRSIDSALSTLKEGERGNLVVTIKPTGASAALIVRGPELGPVKTSVVATFVQPKAAARDWGISFRASFLVTPAPKLGWFAGLRGWYRFLRAYYGRLTAARKAVALSLGFEVSFAEDDE